MLVCPKRVASLFGGPRKLTILRKVMPNFKMTSKGLEIDVKARCHWTLNTHYMFT